jgi:DNA-binding Lrp family transcriptional regulator
MRRISLKKNSLSIYSRSELDYEGLYDFIKTFQADYKYCPSQREIAEHFGVTQPAVHYRLHKAAAAGLLRLDGTHRRIDLVGMRR